MNGAIQPSPVPFYTVIIFYLGIMAFIGWGMPAVRQAALEIFSC